MGFIRVSKWGRLLLVLRVLEAVCYTGAGFLFGGAWVLADESTLLILLCGGAALVFASLGVVFLALRQIIGEW